MTYQNILDAPAAADTGLLAGKTAIVTGAGSLTVFLIDFDRRRRSEVVPFARPAPRD